MHPTNSKEHYEQLLAAHYSWIFGGLDAQFKRNTTLFSEIFSAPHQGLVIDLGCGSGFQSLPLASMGYNIQAVDNSPTLLKELLKNARNKSLTISYHDDNIENFIRQYPLQADIIICMGDTITHLASIATVEALLKDAYDKLKNNGQMVITYRDFSSVVKGTSKFIPVKSTEHKIFSCFLEFHSEYVKVNDVVQQWSEGAWQHEISSYKKVHLPIEQLVNFCHAIGFKSKHSINSDGMTQLELLK